MRRKIYQYQPVNDAIDQSIGILLPMNRAADSYERTLIAISGSADGRQYNTGPAGGTGVFAVSNLKKNTKVIQYIGEKITKKEGDIRSEKRIKKYLKNFFIM